MRLPKDSLEPVGLGLALFCGTLLITGTVALTTEIGMSAQIAFTWAFQFLGGAVIVIACIGTFLQVLSAKPLVLVVPWIVVALFGALLASQNWGVAVALAGIGIGILVTNSRAERVAKQTPTDDNDKSI